ncbi:VOC family protein [Shewanella marina]|uniref:VOC family protein n=1 Tax=Shewanella marina TaxID=487319 RepID=UPI00046EF317|nr:VOC family protein [Shewanella marina]
MAHHKINYIEIPTRDLVQTKAFFKQVFDWQFIDYGPEYSSFSQQVIDGGFFQSELSVDSAIGSPLIVLYSANLEQTLADVVNAGGSIIKPIFSFPGGRRFHFTEPAGNEYAVWSE